jgi:hypothetical protein
LEFGRERIHYRPGAVTLCCGVAIRLLSLPVMGRHPAVDKFSRPDRPRDREEARAGKLDHRFNHWTAVRKFERALSEFNRIVARQ